MYCVFLQAKDGSRNPKNKPSDKLEAGGELKPQQAKRYFSLLEGCVYDLAGALDPKPSTLMGWPVV